MKPIPCAGRAARKCSTRLRGRDLATRELDGVVAGIFERAGLEILLCRSVVFQIGVPESERRGIGVAENGFGLRGAAGDERLRADERHVVRALDEKMVFVARLAAFEWNSLPFGPLVRCTTVEGAGHAHQRQ